MFNGLTNLDYSWFKKLSKFVTKPYTKSTSTLSLFHSSKRKAGFIAPLPPVSTRSYANNLQPFHFQLPSFLWLLMRLQVYDKEMILAPSRESTGLGLLAERVKGAPLAETESIVPAIGEVHRPHALGECQIAYLSDLVQ